MGGKKWEEILYEDCYGTRCVGLSMSKYKDLMRSRVDSAIGQARAVNGSVHQGLRGEILEILIRELFKPLLPADIGVGTGQIVNKYTEKVSSQEDIILYDRSILPPILFNETSGFFPIESVLYTIEVKTTLTATELSNSHLAAKKLNGFGYLPGLKDEKGNEKHHPVEKARSVVFALQSDLVENGKSEAQRYKEIYRDEGPFLAAICVVDKGYWFEMKGSWVKLPTIDPFDEVLGFLGGIMNTYKSVASSRNNPLLGNYIIDMREACHLEIIPSGTQTVVRLFCDRCNQQSMLPLGKTELVLNVEKEFKATNLCSCGGIFKAPAGRYEVRDGELVKISESLENHHG